MNILFAGCSSKYWDKVIDKISEDTENINVYREERYFEPEKLKGIDTLVSYRLNEEQLKYADKLNVLFIPYAGVNHFPLSKLKALDVDVANSHANTKFVAEHAFALSLAVMGRIVEFHNDLAQGEWNRSGLYMDYWTSMYNKKCAVLGTGAIGSQIAKLLKAFSCEITGFKRTLPDSPIPHFDSVTNNLEQAVTDAEIVFVCLPLTQKTEGLIDKTVLEMMKGKFLVNVGRGRIVKQKALYNALKDGILKGAALDVWYNYPKIGKAHDTMPADYPFHELSNVVMSPHAASHTEAAEHADIDETMNNLLHYIKTGELRNKVNRYEEY